MIIDTMSVDELFMEFKKDLPLLNHKIEAGAKFYGRMAKNTRVKERVCYQPITVHRDRYLSQTNHSTPANSRRHRGGVLFLS